MHALRLIGNCCADTNENRARVVRDDRLALITRHLDNEDLMPFNVPVIYNILVDYGMCVRGPLGPPGPTSMQQHTSLD